MQNYTQKYTYDEVGNILELQHIAGSASFTRTYDLDINSNRLFSTRVGTDVYDYTYDLRGNMTAMPHLSDMLWNTQNELKQITRGADATYYQYSEGQRVRKYTDKGTVKEERIYLGSYELYRKFDSSGNIDIERSKVHVSDDKGRIAMLETLHPNYNSDGSEPVLTRYVYSNHLQSASLELDKNGEIISYEEYHPYGTTAYQAINPHIKAVAKRYRYTGKERDEESGLYYHGARYYAPWLGRWTAVDPINSENYNLKARNPERNLKRSHTELSASPYEYTYDNPILYSDPSGEQPPITKEYDNIIKSDNLSTNQSGKFNGSRELMPSPPNKIAKGINYYLNRAIDFKERTGETPPSYYLNYGNKYIHRFKEKTQPTLSPQGQKWLDKALINLQVIIEKKLNSTDFKDQYIENNEKKFINFVFDSHVEAYEKAGLLKLPIMDKVKILLTPDAKDLFSDRGLKQASIISKDQAQYYLNNP